MQDYEHAVSFLGSWGPFQKRVFILLCFLSFPSGFNVMSVMFLLADPSHHCTVPLHWNLSQDWVQASIPLQQVNGHKEKSSCSRYPLDLIQNLSALGVQPGWDLDLNQSALGGGPGPVGLRVEGCEDGWSYSAEFYQSTVVTEFNLVCSDQWKKPLSSLAYFVGGLCGCLFSGQISDWFGRKPVVFGSTIILSVFSAAMAFAPSWPVFTLLYFVVGLGQITSFIVAFVLGSEILVGGPRVLFSCLFLPVFYVAGEMLLPGTAYLVRNWRHLSLVMAVPGLACIPLWWLIPESPRWLASRGRLQEAELVLRAAALENRVDAPSVILQSVEKAEPEKAESLSFMDLLRTKNVRFTTLILWIVWFSNTVSYFGLSFNLSHLYGNPFLNYFLLSAVELPGYVASWLAARSLPRRLQFIMFALLGALALLLILITMDSQPAVTLTLVLLGKFGVLGAAGGMYNYTGELYPTGIRNTAMSSCAMFARLGSAVSPYLLLLAAVDPVVPWVVVGSLCLLSVVLCILLPETFRKPMPDSVQQMGHIQRFMFPWCSAPPKDDGKWSKEQTTAPEIICTTRL
ncbi:solute carrier family 22 member 4-like [Sphaeramia orbicularis]|uniref:solute carrier family 22 member 4-like n=1 Tax=Sphaeramia orbicularis TaxID=375764 RepID=UPI00117D8F4D|nr:solute carrier family 22 member 4-like [Sphaeramia orbicularis]